MTALLILIASACVVFFSLGVAAGFHTGFRAGRINAVDEMQPSYNALLVAFSRVPNEYKNFPPGDTLEDTAWIQQRHAEYSQAMQDARDPERLN